ncbi:MAG TPA: hypothetical protein VGI55_08405 [Solirubrobacteraceae bacterium]
MKRKLIPLASAVAVALAALTALAGNASAHKANDHGGWFGPGFFAQQTVVKGTVTAVNASAGTFTATVDVMNQGFDGGHFFNGRGDDGNSQGWGPGFRGNDGFGGRFYGDHMTPTTTTMTPSTTTMTTPTTTTPTPSTVTITTNSSTKFDVNGNTNATIANLAAGDRFIASFAASTSQGSGTEGNSVRRSHWDQGGSTTVPTTPALEVIAESPPQLYAFVGTVTTAPTALPGSLSVTVSQSLPAGLFTGTQTFQIGSQTLVFGGSLSSLFGGTPTISSGDVVVGGEINMGGLTAAQVEANPLQVLVDFTSTTPSTSPTSPTTPAATEMAKRMKTESFNRALKRLLKHHRRAHRAHHAKANQHHAKA